MNDVNKPEYRPGMSFSIVRGRLLIYHATIRALGNPDYIRFLYNDAKKRVSIQCCEQIDRDGFRVPKVVEGERFSFVINSSPFLSVIYKKCGWDIDQTYNVIGTRYLEYRLIEFKLDDARQIAPNQFVDPENMDAAGLM